MTWPASRAAAANSAPYDGPLRSLLPLWEGQSRYRVRLAARNFTGAPHEDLTLVDLAGKARSRRLELKLNGPSEFSFTLDGYSEGAQLLTELAQDVLVDRWGGEASAPWEPCFFGFVANTQDTISAQTASVWVTCRDYLAMLDRRLVTQEHMRLTHVPQDGIVAALLAEATTAAQSTSGTSFWPGSALPFDVAYCAPDGTPRPAGGPVRTRHYLGNQNIGEALANLSAVRNGFDYDVAPAPGNWGHFRVFYPYQGVLRPDVELVYGATVRALTRHVNSGNYANYARLLGNNEELEEDAPQVFGEAWNADANDVTRVPVGLWMRGEEDADVTGQATLDEKVAGSVDRHGELIPSYSLEMRDGAWSPGFPAMGDVCRLVVYAGRLHIDTFVRVVGITIAIDDEGNEDVRLEVGRPETTFVDIFRGQSQGIAALARR